MNIYVIVEGDKAAKKIYKEWIKYVNPGLCLVEDLNDLDTNNYFIFSGLGQPAFYQRIEIAIEDVNSNNKINRLVIAVDAENATRETRMSKVQEVLNRKPCLKEVKVIIQYFCMETWFLGNLSVFRKKPSDEELLKYVRFHNVRTLDPELLPPYTSRNWNRSIFAYNYLRAGIKDKYSNRYSYSKNNPGKIVPSESYFRDIKNRFETTNHIQSFKDFLLAFSN